MSSHPRFSKKMILFSLTNAHLKSQQNHTSDVFGSTIVNISLDSDLLSLLRKKKYQRLMLTPSADGLEWLVPQHSISTSWLEQANLITFKQTKVIKLRWKFLRLWVSMPLNSITIVLNRWRSNFGNNLMEFSIWLKLRWDQTCHYLLLILTTARELKHWLAELLLVQTKTQEDFTDYLTIVKQ